ncbi:MAG TPA: ATP-binding protein [Nitrospirales bacterium]|nr:ATP-binding protein [Nitrospira sp. MA-1]HNP59214.1 ATP-binding protein [Nitrospirales bacterium]
MTTRTETSGFSEGHMEAVGESIFHRMRNVLNSIHVSAGLIHHRLRESHVADVGRVADMLEAHSHDYGWYLTQDPKGKKIPNFLGQLNEELSQNHLDTLTELTTLNYHLEQLEYYLTVGQTPHRVGGFKDTIQFAAIMDEALASHQCELDRMGVQVCREYQRVGEGILEVSKLLRILVNLIRNAINGMREITSWTHRLTLYVFPCPDREGFVRLQVADTGRGIPLEGLTRVFSPQASGEQTDLLPNLHASALAAKELTGSLRVWSDGLMQGAIFTLDLPVIHMEGER